MGPFIYLFYLYLLTLKCIILFACLFNFIWINVICEESWSNLSFNLYINITSLGAVNAMPRMYVAVSVYFSDYKTSCDCGQRHQSIVVVQWSVSHYVVYMIPSVTWSFVECDCDQIGVPVSEILHHSCSSTNSYDEGFFGCVSMTHYRKVALCLFITPKLNSILPLA